jgi:2',3'-cyclic-nucleotide 2'-phosphodiesterase (5'-nucleotidase family)
MNWLLVFLLLSSCSIFKKSNEQVLGHSQLYSDPESDNAISLSKNERRIVIVATHDQKGQLEAYQEKVEDIHSPEKTLISVGGVEVFARYLEILRETYPSEVILVDSGNSIAGSLLARESKGNAIFATYEQVKYDAIALAAPDLAAGPKLKSATPASKWLPDVLKRFETPLVMSNLIDLKTTQPVAWGKSTPQLLKEINGVKVGFVSLFPDDLPKKLGAGVLNGLYVEPAIQALLKQTRSLRLKGANVIILTMYGGIKCGHDRAAKKNLPVSKVNFDPKDPSACELDSPLGQFLQEIPPGSVDVVITGGATNKVANYINGIPVIQAFNDGRSFARVDLVWDNRDNIIVTEKTLIHQPIRLCHRFFKKTEDCYTEDSSVDHRELIPARYLNQTIFPEPATALWMNRWRELLALNLGPILFNDKKFVPKQGLAEAILASTAADVAVVGGKSWSLSFPAGQIGWREIFKQKSAQENIQLIQVSGAELNQIKEALTEKHWWAYPGNWEDLILETQLTLAVNTVLWDRIVSLTQLNKEVELADLLIADTMVSWQQDSVSSRASGRSPALPRTQP